MQNNSVKKIFFFGKDCSTFSPNSVEHAYLALLNKDLASANVIFSNLDSPRAKWGKILVSILNGYMEIYPTYFLIRNFLEIDLDFLIKNEKIEYTEQLLGALDYFVKINQETYKFAARAMYANKLYSASLMYMEKSKFVNYHDPELHFMLTRYYYDVHDYKQAYFYINECLNLLPDYYPALIMKEKIEETWI